MSKENIVWHDHHVTKAERIKQHNQKPCVLWFTGLSGSGKSTLLSLICGTIIAGSGRVSVAGNDIAFSNALGTLGHLDGISVEPTGGLRRAHVRLREGVRPSQLLQALGGDVEVSEFVKIRPTMESLFIQAVDRTSAETTKA